MSNDQREQRTRYTCAETAKLIRAALKQHFPGVKFSVRSSTYSGGASIRVRWNFGPREKDVDRIAKRFSGATFDGMQDLKEYHDVLVADENGRLRSIHYGADFVFTDRDTDKDDYLAIPERDWKARSDYANAGRTYWHDIQRQLCALLGIEYAGQYTVVSQGANYNDGAGTQASRIIGATDFRTVKQHKLVRIENGPTCGHFEDWYKIV